MMRKWLLLSIVVGVLALTAQVASAGDPPFDAKAMSQAVAAQEANTADIMSDPNVVGTAIGITDGRPVIKVFTASEGTLNLPQSLGDVPVEVEVTGRYYAQTDPTARQNRPVPIGVSTGHPAITAGTLGARVTDGTDVYALSNNHVYADINNASIGDDVIQPGTFDGGSLPTDFIGELYDYEPIDFNWPNSNTMDAAIALTDTSLVGTATPSDDGYGQPSSTPVAAFVGQSVTKYGRTTELTVGTVIATNGTVDVCYDSLCNMIARFIGQVIISPGTFSAGGDSGSLIVSNDASHNPVALLFAGSSTQTIGMPIGVVLTRFGVTIDDGSGSGPSVDKIAMRALRDGSQGKVVARVSSDPGTLITARFYYNGGLLGQVSDTTGGNGNVKIDSSIVNPIAPNGIFRIDIVTPTSGVLTCSVVIVDKTSTCP